LKSTSFLCAAACALVSVVHASTSIAATAPATPGERGEARGQSSVDVGVLGGVGFPRPLAVEGVLEFDRLVLFGIEYSTLPTTTISGVQTSLWALAGDARIFPFRNGFFVGIRAGRQHLGEFASASIAGLGTLSAMESNDTTFINPRLGFLWTWHALAFGIDAGVQIPLSTSMTTTVPAGISPPSAVLDVNRALTQDVLPTVDLLRIGVVM
jgi:hypothetical protein